MIGASSFINFHCSLSGQNDFCVRILSSSLCTSAGLILITFSPVKSSGEVELAPCALDAVVNTYWCKSARVSDC